MEAPLKNRKAKSVQGSKPLETRSLAEALRKKMERAEESVRKIDPEELKRILNR